ncbi:hypothetical protein ABFS82_13G040000 [Erythranthe guttata]|uniref:F-box domain-containing protein n=1 Tax=Erythranthe guttata TaxID=4155 RepID=A0A022QSC7_ERYGU|nr:hypothetical protein MIMGU_mgv1a006101mg [Erythranthe guttata]
MAITERDRRSRQKQNTVPIDRLSDLPDSVLTHILSFLPTKFSVRTSILGQRWRFLWAYVPNLIFRNDSQKSINRVLLLRKMQKVNTFCLSDDDDRYRYINRENGAQCKKYQIWITFAVERNVQILHLCYSSWRDEDVLLGLPGCLFTCKTLVHLKLESCGVIPVRVAVCFPRLKKLHLLYVQYEADDALPNLLSGCPVLEDLLICLYPDMVYCNVSSTTVKSLVLDFISVGCGGRADRLDINTPSVEYLQMSDYFTEHIKCGVLTSLTQAYINFDSQPDYHHHLHSRSLLDFFDTLCNVERLNLDFSYCPEIINSVLSAWTTSFRNLTELELRCDCRLLSKFLENADNLEILCFTEEPREEIKSWKEPPQQVPACLLSRLRIVKLPNIRGEKHEFKIIKYLLRNAQVLERMEISYPRSLSSNEENNMLKKISLFQRGSRACKVAFGAASPLVFCKVR